MVEANVFLCFPNDSFCFQIRQLRSLCKLEYYRATREVIAVLPQSENQMADSSSKVEMELDFAADFVMPSTVQAPRSSRAALTDEDGEEAGAFCTNQTFKSWRARTQLAAELETYRCYRTQICKLYRDK